MKASTFGVHSVLCGMLLLVLCLGVAPARRVLADGSTPGARPPAQDGRSVITSADDPGTAGTASTRQPGACVGPQLCRTTTLASTTALPGFSGNQPFFQTGQPHAITTDRNGNVVVRHTIDGLSWKLTSLTPTAGVNWSIDAGGFGDFNNAYLATDPGSGHLILLKTNGDYFEIDPATGVPVSGLSLASLPLDTSSVWDIFTGTVKPFAISMAQVRFGDVAIFRRGNQSDMFITGWAVTIPFVMRLRLINGVPTSFQALVSSLCTSAGVFEDASGVAVNSQGQVFTTLPYRCQPPLGDFREVLVRFSADIGTAGPAPQIVSDSSINIFSRGMTVDAADNLYIATGFMGATPCGLGGTFLIFSADLSQSICFTSTALNPDSWDVAISPANDRAYLSLFSLNVVQVFFLTPPSSGADLVVSVTGAPSPVTVGTELTYTMTVTNNGPGSATGVSLSFGWTTPGGGSGTVTASQGTCNGTTHTCALGTLAAGAQATVTLKHTPTSAGTSTATATVTANEPDPDTTNNSASTSVTINPAGAVGGKGLMLTDAAGGVQLTWTGGTAQTSYLVGRYNLNTGAFDLLPSPTAPLPATATSFTDTASLSSQFYCYLVLPMGGSGVLGVSDMECLLPHIATATGAPRGFAIRLDQSSTASLSWTSPAAASPTSYLLIAVSLADGSVRTVPLPATATSTTDNTGGAPTCYLLMAMSGSTALGYTNLLCGFPGIAQFGAPTAAAGQRVEESSLAAVTAAVRGKAGEVSRGADDRLRAAVKQATRPGTPAATATPTGPRRGQR